MDPVIILCLIYMAALVGAIAFRLIKCSRKERLKRLKSFKHGKFALIYIAVIPLFFLAQRFNGQSVEGAVWLAIRACIEVVVLRFDYSAVAPLMGANLLFHIAIDVLFSLVLLNTFMLTASICGQAVANRISLFVAEKFRKKSVVVVGTGANALDILASVPKGHAAILMGELTPALKEECYARRAAYCGLKSGDDLGALLARSFRNFSKQKVSVIMALEDDERSLFYVRKFCELIQKKGPSDLPLTEDAGLSVHVFVSKANETVFSRYTEATGGVVRFVNRHKLISMDFIDKYPLTQYMTKREIDYSTATVRDEIGLNVFMIGFGKLNESLFLASVSNNQFLTLKEGKLSPKPVHYHIYDRYYPQGKFTKDKHVHSGDLHHGYLRYRDFLDYYGSRRDEFLELLPLPAEVQTHPLEVTHPEFYTSVRDELLKGDTYNYIIVSFGTDMENIGLAEKLQQKIKEWNVSSFVKIFAKVRDASIVRELQADRGEIEFFGAGSTCVYNAEVILHEKAERMARLRHLLYATESKVKEEGADKTDAAAIEEAARKKWYSYTEYQRQSNLYACLSLRMKLHLCGYDYTENGKDVKDAAAAFLSAYETDDKRVPSVLEVDGKTVWKYSNAEQFRPSRRWYLAAQEHLRWCANMIASGLIPCSKKEILTLDKEEMLAQRKHANLTTMEGLVEFRKLIAKATGKSEEETDVIRYDYQLMDDADWLLPKCGYTLIEK